jgi:hypothetical protein
MQKIILFQMGETNSKQVELATIPEALVKTGYFLKNLPLPVKYETLIKLDEDIKNTMEKEQAPVAVIFLSKKLSWKKVESLACVISLFTTLPVECREYPKEVNAAASCYLVKNVGSATKPPIVINGHLADIDPVLKGNAAPYVNNNV